MTNLQAGTVYKFKVQARNSYGLSEYSNELSLVCGFIPDVPAPPTIVIIADQVITEWVAPNPNGSAILSYRIKFEQKDGIFEEELTHCDGTDAGFVTVTKCTVPILTLQASPFLLELGDEIRASVSATNEYGESEQSLVSTDNPLVLEIPDAPLFLADNVEITNDAIAALTWQDGHSYGGTPIIDYRVSYDQAVGEFIVLDEGIVPQAYQTTVTLTKGAIYTFRVEARNTVGFSLPSEELQILVAQVPDKPETPLTTRVGDTIETTWDVLYDGSTPIFEYKIEFLARDGETVQTELVYCDGANADVVSTQSCTVPSPTFLQAPWSILWGEAIYGRVQARNIKGWSEFSEFGSGALIWRIPDVPINLRNVPNLTDKDSIGLMWEDGLEDGGTPVLDYLVYYDNGTGATFT